MATKHQFKFKTAKGQNMYWDGSSFRTKKDCGFYGGEKHYIHPDYHEMLTPRVGDIIESITGIAGRVAEIDYTSGRPAYAIKDHLGNVVTIVPNVKQIIQRDGKAFFTPEEEKLKEDK